MPLDERFIWAVVGIALGYILGRFHQTLREIQEEVVELHVDLQNYSSIDISELPTSSDQGDAHGAEQEQPGDPPRHRGAAAS